MSSNTTAKGGGGGDWIKQFVACMAEALMSTMQSSYQKCYERCENNQDAADDMFEETLQQVPDWSKAKQEEIATGFVRLYPRVASSYSRAFTEQADRLLTASELAKLSNLRPSLADFIHEAYIMLGDRIAEDLDLLTDNNVLRNHCREVVRETLRDLVAQQAGFDTVADAVDGGAMTSAAVSADQAGDAAAAAAAASAAAATKK